MAININNIGSKSPVTQQTNQTQNKQSAQASADLSQAKQVRQDSVSLTPQAKQLNELQKKANDSSQVNQKKVEQLKKAIIDGDYKIDPEKLAASIAKFEFSLD